MQQSQPRRVGVTGNVMIQELDSNQTSTSPTQMVRTHLAMVVALDSVGACCPDLVADLGSGLAGLVDPVDPVDPAVGPAVVAEER